MRPNAFAYFAPHTLDEALALLAEHGDRARPLAGGQSLMQRINRHEESPEVVIDLTRVGELDYVRQRKNGALSIGAMTCQQRVIESEDAARVNPALGATAAKVAFRAIRVRGTLGGTVANAEPGAQLPLLLSMLGAEVTLARRSQRLTLALSDFLTGPRETTLAPDELLVELSVPTLGARTGYAVAEFRRGHSGPPLVTVIALLDLAPEGTVRSARLGVSGASAVPERLRDAEAALIGQRATSETYATAARVASVEQPYGDAALAGSGLRERAMRGLLIRALTESASHATQRHSQEGH